MKTLESTTEGPGTKGSTDRESRNLRAHFARCAELIARADGLLITAGAGLGVDSGLPDFRGREGMWRAYPALGRARIGFEQIACPDAFRERPRLAWGFYGHRLKLYRETEPGPAFRTFDAIAQRLPAGAFVFTSNVDGQFQQARFAADRVVECHGSIHHLQCLEGCRNDVWPADDLRPVVDEEHCELIGDLPQCPVCKGLARPNILMFGDNEWIDERMRTQRMRLNAWRRKVRRLVVVEIGAGTAIPTVRLFGEHLGAPLVRINPTESRISANRGISLPINGTQGAYGIAAELIERGFLDSLEG